MSADTSGPAFSEVPADCNGYEGRPGMTLRDYFASHAPAPSQWYVEAFANHRSGLNTEQIAGWNYLYADAMLKARSKA